MHGVWCGSPSSDQKGRWRTSSVARGRKLCDRARCNTVDARHLALTRTSHRGTVEASDCDSTVATALPAVTAIITDTQSASFWRLQCQHEQQQQRARCHAMRHCSETTVACENKLAHTSVDRPSTGSLQRSCTTNPTEVPCSCGLLHVVGASELQLATNTALAPGLGHWPWLAHEASWECSCSQVSSVLRFEIEVSTS